MPTDHTGRDRTAPSQPAPRRARSGAAVALRLAAYVVPRYVERRVARAFLTPRRVAVTGNAGVALPPPDRAVQLSLGPHAVAAWRWGEGPAVMLVHGWEDDHRCFDALIVALRARDIAVVAFDLPAHGQSGGRLTMMPAIVAAMRDAAVVLGPVRALVGHSFGGAAVTLALGQGIAAGRAVVVAAPLSVSSALDHISQRLGLSAARRAGIGRELYGYTGVTVESLDLEPVAARLAVPALVVHSRDDRMVPVRASERLARVWPGAELLAVDGLGHRRVLADPAVTGRIADFLGAAPAG